MIKKLSFGDLILLKPELLNSYASDIVNAARQHPDGIGCVKKRNILDGEILITSSIIEKEDQLYLLHATVELFIRLGLAIEQNDLLVFPSKFNRKRPEFFDNPVIKKCFIFKADTEKIYATLVAKLYYGEFFILKNLWKNAVQFADGENGSYCFQILKNIENRDKLILFYNSNSDYLKINIFEGIIERHLFENRIEFSREEPIYCNHCGEHVRDQNAINRAIAKKIAKMPCLYCFKMISIDGKFIENEGFELRIKNHINSIEGAIHEKIEIGGDIISGAGEIISDRFNQWISLDNKNDTLTFVLFDLSLFKTNSENSKINKLEWKGLRFDFFDTLIENNDKNGRFLIKRIGNSIIFSFKAILAALEFCFKNTMITNDARLGIKSFVVSGDVSKASILYNKIIEISETPFNIEIKKSVWCDEETVNLLSRSDNNHYQVGRKISLNSSSYELRMLKPSYGFIYGNVITPNRKPLKIIGRFKDKSSTESTFSNKNGRFMLNWNTEEDLVGLEIDKKFIEKRIINHTEVEVEYKPKEKRKRKKAKGKTGGSGGRKGGGGGGKKGGGGGR